VKLLATVAPWSSVRASEPLLTLLGFSGSSKLILTFVASGTAVAPCAGLKELTCGGRVSDGGVWLKTASTQ
jgi:hypothetical protein